MTELQRLLESSNDEVERALLDAVGAERPHATALRGTALALGLSASTADALAATLPAATVLGTAAGVEVASGVLPLGSSGGVASSAAATAGVSGSVAAFGSASLGVLGKSLLGGTLLSFMALTGLDRTVGLSTTSASVSRTASAARPAGEARVPAFPAPAATPSVAGTAVLEPSTLAQSNPAADSRRGPARLSRPAPVADTDPVDPAPAQAALAVPAPPHEASATGAAAAAAAKASLTAEIRLLDRARAALSAGDTVAAGQLLDAYASNRPSAVLTQEAGLLRVKLLLARGQRPAAAELARRIIATHPESTHVDSLRRLAAER